MKKIIALFLCVLFCFSAMSCSGGTEETTASENNQVNTVVPRIKLVLDSAAVVAGETVDIAVNISEAPLTACFDVFVYAPQQLTYESSDSLHSELIIASNIVESDNGKYVAVRGMVATTCDLSDDSVCVIQYKVSEDVKSGDELVLTVQVPLYQIGTDENGNDVYSVSESVVTEDLTLIVE